MADSEIASASQPMESYEPKSAEELLQETSAELKEKYMMKLQNPNILRSRRRRYGAARR